MERKQERKTDGGKTSPNIIFWKPLE